MKKFFALFAAAMTVFALASCDPDTPDNPDNPNDPDKGKTEIPALTLSAANIDVAGIDGDYLAVVDNAAKTIKINVEYADKENVKALTVAFISLPEGFTTSGEYQRTFNYSDGATQTVAFMYGEEKAAEYVISVAIGAADPKFLTLMVGGIDAMSGEVRMASAASLSHLAVEFTVDPADAVVSVNDKAIESGAELDFTDKINGVTFTLTLGEVTKTHKVVVITSGLRNARRMWGHYANPSTISDDWFQTQANDYSMADHWLRTCAMDNDYVYLAQHKGAAAGAYILSLADGSIVGRLSVEGVTGGTHQTSAIRTIPDGDGGFKILQCNLVINNAGTLTVYKWDNKDSKPTVVLSYPNVDGLRLGDKMGVNGTWKDGEVSFLATAGNPRKLYTFKITNGTISDTPTISELGDMGIGSYGQVYWYSATELLASVSGTKPMSFTVSGNTLTQSFYDEESLVFGSTDQGFQFFSFNDRNYMALMHLESGLTDGSLRILEMTGEDLKSSLKAVDANHVFRYGIGDPTECPVNAAAVGNSVADCALRVIGGETYLCGVVADVGVSLFKLEE